MSVAITGIGCVSALGDGVAATLDALRNARHGCAIHEFERLDGTTVSAPAYLAVKPDATKYLDKRKLRRMDRLVKMAAVSARQALDHAGIETDSISPERLGVVTGTALGALNITQQFIDSWLTNGEEHASPLKFMNSVHGIMASQVALDLGATGVNLTTSHREISFEAALASAVSLLESGRADIILVGAADELTSLAHEFVSRLGVLSHSEDDAGGCQPWEARATIVPGDASAFFVLEPTSTQRKPLAILDWAQTGRGEPTHVSADYDLVTTIREGWVRSHDFRNNHEAVLQSQYNAPVVSHNGSFGVGFTTSAMQFAVNVLMLAGREAFPCLSAGEMVRTFDAPARILHENASPSCAWGACALRQA